MWQPKNPFSRKSTSKEGLFGQGHIGPGKRRTGIMSFFIWTDEASVEIGKESRVVWVWRRPGERYDEKCTVPTFKPGRQSLMIWGGIAHGRLGPLIRIPKGEKSGA